MQTKTSDLQNCNLKFDNDLKYVDSTQKELVVENYIILFGGRDLAGEFFTKKTDIESAYTKSGVLYADFEHGFDPDRVGNNPNDILGIVDWSSVKTDDNGVFVTRILNRQAKYMAHLEGLIDEKRIGTSSMCVPRASERKSDGEITRWPLMRDTLTLTPCEPRMLSSNTLSNIKSLREFFPYSKSLFIPDDKIKGLNFDKAENIRDLEKMIRDEFNCSKSVASNFLSHAKRILAGDLSKYEQQISDLEQRINKYELDSLFKTLKEIG